MFVQTTLRVCVRSTSTECKNSAWVLYILSSCNVIFWLRYCKAVKQYTEAALLPPFLWLALYLLSSKHDILIKVNLFSLNRLISFFYVDLFFSVSVSRRRISMWHGCVAWSHGYTRLWSTSCWLSSALAGFLAHTSYKHLQNKREVSRTSATYQLAKHWDDALPQHACFTFEIWLHRPFSQEWVLFICYKY